MAKKGKLTQEEKYIIHGMQLEGKEPKEIAKFMDRTERVVLSNMIDVEDLAEDEDEDEEVEETKAKDTLTINTTDGKGDNGVLVMTAAASAKADADYAAKQPDPTYMSKYTFKMK